MEDPQNTEPQQFNVGADGSEHADHQTTGEVALDNQQHIQIDPLGQQKSGGVVLDDQQLEQLACATSIPVNEKSKRFRN
jgi:hypothetical protein